MDNPAIPPALSPLLITLRLDDASFVRLNSLRTEHFPAARNQVPAHVTLFHALPGAQETLVRDTLASLTARTQKLPLRLGALRFLGRGVAIEVESAPLIEVRAGLRRVFGAFLTAQDAQGWKHPHVTVQNKVTAPVARQTFERLNREWEGWDGQGEGLLLWYYRGGPWEAAGDYPFVAASA